MTRWNTNLMIRTPGKTMEAGMLEIKREIFQGDSLNPLWLCSALRPLNHMLNLGYHNPIHTKLFVVYR